MIKAETAPTAGNQAAAAVRETTTATFRADVLSESTRQPVLVAFYAPSSAASTQFTPVLEKLVKLAEGKVKLVRMNVEAQPQIAQQLGIQSLPCVYAFQRGQPVDGFMGVLPEAQVRGFIERLTGPLGSEMTDLLEEADALAGGGETEAAAEIYAEILAAEPANAPARASLAKLLVAAGNLEGARALLEETPAEARKDAALAAAQAALEIADQASGVGDTGELRQRLSANPKDHQARFDLALALNAAGQREEAADALLEIIRMDRKWEEDGARKQLIQFFESWGAMDGAAQQAPAQIVRAAVCLRQARGGGKDI